MSPPEDRSKLIEWLQWFLTAENGTPAYVRDLLASAGVIVTIGLVLFGVSGVWPPLVAIESPSMTPNMKVGDLVFVVDENRFKPEAAYKGTGVVTTQIGRPGGAVYKEFGMAGDVIIFRPSGDGGRTPIIHRARFWVNDSENWYDEANPEFLAGADNCAELMNCPAPQAGFITRGDANPQYDQVNSISGPVKPTWVIGTAEFRIPYLGWIRLALSNTATSTPPGFVDKGIFQLDVS